MTRIGFEVGQIGKAVPSNKDYEKVIAANISGLPVFDTFRQDYSIANGGDKILILKHKLPFVPWVHLYYKLQSNNDKWISYPGPASGIFVSSNFLQIIYLRIDKENITIRIFNGEGTTQIMGIKVIIFAFPIALSM